MAGIVDMATFDFGMKRWHTLIVKRYFAAYQDVEYDAKAPYIHFGAGIGFGVK